jgi:uncharacterized membrane protein
MTRITSIAKILLVSLSLLIIFSPLLSTEHTEAAIPAFTAYGPAQVENILSARQPATNGIWLAWIIMVGMILALVFVVVALVRAFQGKVLPEPKGWVDWTIPVLSLIGLGVAIYLTYVEGSQAQAICGPIGDCNAVQSSKYAMIFDLIPVGLFGAFGYIAILAAWLWRRKRKDALAQIAGPAIFGMTAFGVLYSIYLTYLEIFVIHAVCIWCLSSAVIITLLLLLSLPAASRWLAAMDEEE